MTVNPGPSSVKRGAMIFIDNFTSAASHGNFVQGAARSLGATGDTYQVNQHQMIDGRLTMPHAGALRHLQNGFGAEQLPVEHAREQLDSFVNEAAAGTLRLATGHLADLEAEGFENSVVNLSQGVDTLVLMDMIKRPLSVKSALSPKEQQRYSSNLQTALFDPDEPLSNNEQAVDRRLLQRVSQVLKESSEITNAVEEWRAGVRSFEAGHNSVVVAAGNSGQTQKALARAEFLLDGTEDRNLLAVPEVTTVGATKSTPDGGVALSSASSFGPEVDILTDGEYQGRSGTSYSSPRVANALRAAHVLRPDFSSEQAETWLKETLADRVELDGHAVGLLSLQKAEYLLSAVQRKQQGG